MKVLVRVEESRAVVIVVDIDVASVDKPIDDAENTDKVTIDFPDGDKIPDGSDGDKITDDSDGDKVTDGQMMTR